MKGETSWISHCFDDMSKEIGGLDSFSELIDEGNKETAAVSVDLILPDDLLERILAFLPIASIFRAGSVCRRWHEIVSSKRFLWNFSNVLSQKPWYFMFTSSDEPVGYAYDPILRKWYGIELPCIETKINCTRLIGMLIEGTDFASQNVASLSLLVGLLRLVKDKKHPNGVVAGLNLLKTICSHEPVRNSFVNVGAVPQLVELIPGLNNECLELVLHILELLSSTPEGRLALKDCPSTIPNVVKLLMKASENCTQLALSILWSICKFAPEECASLAVDAGLAAKLLLVIQSGCNPVLKQRSAELLKLCSLNYTTTIFISKCKLTRTIQ